MNKKRSRMRIPIGVLLFVSFLMFFMVRFVKVTLDKDDRGNLAYVQLLNSGMPLIKASYYDDQAYAESKITVKSLALEALNLDEVDPLSLALKQIPYLNSFEHNFKPSYLTLNNIDSFSLNDDSLEILAEKEEKEEEADVSATRETSVYDSSLKKELNQGKPEVLIYHTHTTESYYPAEKDSQDENLNVVGVGDVLAKELEENYGVSVIHDKTMHSASYNDSYKRSRETVKKYINKYEDFKLVIDLHRDSIPNDKKAAVTKEINGESIAKIMMVTTRNSPNYESAKNLAENFTAKANELFPGMARSVYTYNRGSGAFNQDLSKNSLLIETGAQCNTIEESKGTAKYIARLVAEQLNRK